MTLLELRWAPLAALLVVASVGCGDDDGGTDSGVEDGGATDAGPEDADPRPDGARSCTADPECDDGVHCTRDFCDPRGFCRNQTDPAVCDDGVFCNGVEQCDPLHDCRPGPRQTCNDDDVCTIDVCDEEEKLCRHEPRDLDEDGEADWHCADGTDCDDRDPRRGALFSEICADFLDNDCDGDTDEPECGRPMHDTCDDPLDVSAGGLFTIAMDGASPDYTLGCDSTRKDVVARLTLAAPRSVRISAEGPSVTAVALRTTCGDRLTETECGSGFPGEIRTRELAAGTYFVIVSSAGIGEVDLLVELGDPVPAATNESCASPIDVSAGGRFEGTFVDATDDHPTGCGFGAAADLVYSFTLAAPRDVTIAALAPDGETLDFSVRTACADMASELRCVRGSPARARLRSLPAGTYYLIVQGPSYREVDFTLDVAFSDPTAPPMGESCAVPIPLALGVEQTGTLADKEDDVNISCGYYYRDAVYTFTTTERRDVTIEVDGGFTFMYVSLRTSCGDGASQLRCVSGSPGRARLRDLPAGTYYVIVESYSGTGFTIRADATAPTTVVPVSGNDNCSTPHLVPATGGVFSGDTTAMLNDVTTSTCGSMATANDAVFRLDLTATKRVVASTEGSAFDTVLHLHTTMCTSGAEAACDDDGGDGTTSVLDRVLSPGSHYFVVDGFGAGSAGAYIFEVMVSDP